MSAEQRQYYGAALSSFVLAFGDSNSIVRKILADIEVGEINPQTWYDYDWAMDVYSRIAGQVGPAAVKAVGRKIIDAARFPPGIDSVSTVLMSLGAAFKLNSRGPVGTIFCTIEDEYSATIVRTQKSPCALSTGIIAGACARHGAKALIEHVGECQGDGAPTCTYRVSW